MQKAEILSFPTIPGSGGSRTESLWSNISWRKKVVINQDFEVLGGNFDVSKIRDLETIPT
jgi:hypothetical protein